MAFIGEELKRERELRDISLREISDATKISMRILEAIEKNNYKVLPGGIFNRNFIRAYAEFIGLDPETAVNKYCRQTSALTEDPLPQIHPKVSAGSQADWLSPKNLLIYGVITLVVVSLLFFALYRLRKSGNQTSALLRSILPASQVGSHEAEAVGDLSL